MAVAGTELVMEHTIALIQDRTGLFVCARCGADFRQPYYGGNYTLCLDCREEMAEHVRRVSGRAADEYMTRRGSVGVRLLHGYHMLREQEY